MGRRRTTPGKGRARALLEHVVGDCLPRDATVRTGRVRFLERGISSRTFVAHVEVTPDPDGRSGGYVARLPVPEADADRDERLRREADLLEQLALRPLPFRVPEVVGLVENEDGLVVVQRLLDGYPLNECRNSKRCPPPWEIAGKVAAAVHRLNPTGLPIDKPPHTTRRQHGHTAVDSLDNSGNPLLDDAHQWALAHLPPDEPLCLIHGDLLAQNLLVDLGLSDEPPLPPGVLDWEYARLGDPADELSIITRGVRSPFGATDGLHRLLSAYRESGGLPVTANDVRLFELVLVGTIYRDLAEDRPWEAEQYGRQIQRILREVE